MGLFSSQKKTFVASVAYNMAGSELDRPNYLKSVIGRHIFLSDKKKSIADDIIKGQFEGPAFNQRSLFRWATSQYPEGSCIGEISNKLNLDGPTTAIVEGIVSLNVGETLKVQSAAIDSGDITYWAEKHILDNYPTLYDTAWSASFDEATGKLNIVYADASSEQVTITGYDPKDDYLIVYYRILDSGVTEGWSGGSLTLQEAGQSMFIYKMGSGTVALDGLSVSAVSAMQFFPIVPLRRDNKPISDAAYSSVYSKFKKGYKKSTGRDINEVLDQIEDNDAIDDVDQCFLVHGCELNTPVNVAKEYIYLFLRELMNEQDATVSDVTTWIGDNTYSGYVGSLQDWETNYYAEGETANGGVYLPPPSPVVRDTPNISTLEVKSRTDVAFPLNYKMKLSWLAIGETVSAGLGKVGAVKDELWWDVQADITNPGVVVRPAGQINSTIANDKEFSHVKLYWQYADNAYKVLDIYGLIHENFVYQGNSVEINAKEAIEDSEDSGFYIPLHYDTLKSMSLVKQNELALNNRLIIFNSVETVTIRWYETKLFRIVVSIVVAVAIGVIFPGAGGILGANALIGGMMGFTGVAALIAGAVANAVAAMIITAGIQGFAVGAFGEEFGPLVAAILGFIVMNSVSGLVETGTFNLNWSDLFKAENILGLTDLFSKGIQGWSQGRITEFQQDTENARNEYIDDLEEIERLTAEVLGTGDSSFDTLLLTNLEPVYEYRPESPSSFLSRTSITGDDIVSMSQLIIEDYAELSLELRNLI